MKRYAVAILLLGAAGADAEVTGNIGFSSDYFYRGIFQSASSANGGIDVEHDGLYAGVWAADVDDGLEIDGYFGYGGTSGEVDYSIGYTGYFYTGDFDDTYQELNFGLAYGIASVDTAFGRYDNFGGPTADYVWYALTLEQDGFYGRLAGFGRDFDGNYLELGYGTTFAEVDVSLTAIFSDDDLTGDDDQSLVLGVSKTFTLR